jgi:hypothetical protein
LAPDAHSEHPSEFTGGIANSVVSNRQARAATKAFIKGKLGLALTDGEERTLTSAQMGGTPVERMRGTSVEMLL